MWRVRSLPHNFGTASFFLFFFLSSKGKEQNAGFDLPRHCETFNPFSSCVTEEDLLMFDLQSLATLAAARALEMGSQEGSGAAPGRCFPARRILNLRRKFNWTPRNEPVNQHLQPSLGLHLNGNALFDSKTKRRVGPFQACPAKGSMETMEGPELAMRVKLAELQRRYKEKQKELAKLQRKHDHQ